MVHGTEGYLDASERFIAISQRLDFFEVNRDFIPYLPKTSKRILDLGAGVGQNAAALAEFGHTVVAVEPLNVFRKAGQARYQHLSITWIADSLPYLKGLKDPPFDFILLDGVWHHLSVQERPIALQTIISLLKPGGRIAMSLRNGPAGMGTCVYPTDIRNTIKAGQSVGLKPRAQWENQASILPNKMDVIWSRLVLEQSDRNLI